MITLFDYQEAAVRDLRATFARGAKAPLLVLPTGGGKTICFTYLTARAAERGKRVLLLAHRKELVSQISAALDRWDVPHGIIAPSAPPSSQPVQAAVLTGATPDRERSQMIRDLGAGTLHVLASCNVVSEGTDIPTVTAAILLRPTASYALAMQQMGRALRAYPGKDRAILLDHAGNSLRHGTPMDPVE